MKDVVLLLLLVFAGVIAPASAHHSDAGYDRDALVAFEGVVNRYVFRNPHIMIYVETEDEQGGIVEWEIETGSVPIMNRSGWTSTLLNEGDVVTIQRIQSVVEEITLFSIPWKLQMVICGHR